MAMVDVTIRGAGVFGLAVAWACQQRGAKVRVIDPGGVAGGASGGVVGALAPHVPENWNPKKAFQLDSLLMAEGFWKAVEDASGQRTGYTRTGRLQPIADERALALARGRQDSAKALWQHHATWRLVRISGVDWEPASPTGALVFDSLSALIHPRQATQALATAIVAGGGQIVTDGEPEGAEVWATGVRGLEGGLGNGVKGQAAVLAYDARGLPQLYADALHIIPHCDGTVAVGSTSEREFNSPDATDDQLEDVIARARAALPVLRDAPVLERWAGVRPRAKSRAPLLGHHPLKSGAFIANGGFKIGFGMAPKVGEVMADLVLEGINTIPEGFGAN